MKITTERLREVLDYDPLSGRFVWKRTGKTAGSINQRGYVMIGIDGIGHQAHRLAWLHYYGVPPKSGIDHKNRWKADNRIDNLREATTSQNEANKPTQSNHLKGIAFHRGARKWQAQIRTNGKNQYLGLFESQVDAHNAYMWAARLIHGEFACAV